MKFIYKFTALAGLMAALPFMSSCKDDNESFVTASRLSIAVSTESDFKNRSVIEGGTLPDGSVIGLSLVDTDGVGYGDKDYGLFTATSSTGTQPQKWSLSGDIILDGNKGTLYGFYPYSDAVTDIKSIPVVSGNTDYMYAIPVEDLDGNHPTAGIVMKHALTAVRVSLALGTYPGQGVVSSMVISGDLTGNAVMDATTGALIGLGGLSELDITPENPVTLTSEPYSFTGLVIPTAETGKLTVCVTVDGTPLTSTLSSCDLTAGNLLNITATLNGKELVVSSVTIDEWQGTTSANLNKKKPENLLVAMYNVTSTTENTRILSNTSAISKMFIDGIEMSPTTSYRFSSTGEHVVEFALANENEIANNAFSGCKQLTGVYIPENLVKIGNNAFSGCEGLTGELIIPNSVTSIREAAFSGCSGLTSLKLGTGVQTIGDYAFRYCKGLTTLTIPNSVTTIGNYAFRECLGLTSLELGIGVQTIGEYAFYKCSGLTSLKLGTGVQTIGEYAFWQCTGLNALVIPNSVTSIEGRAFQGCLGLTSLKLGTSVQTIGDYAFERCSGLTGKLVIPNSVTSIGFWAFQECSELTSLELGTGVQFIGYQAFNKCTGLTGELVIPNSVTSIREAAFSGCSGLTSLKLGTGVQTIGDYAFQGCSGFTGELVIPNLVTSIGDYAFSGCSELTSLKLGTGVQTIGDYAFLKCSGLTSLDLGTGVQTIGNYAFRYCSGLTVELVIPNSVTTIRDYAFQGCFGLTSLKLGTGVQTIGGYAFEDCSGLTGKLVIPNLVTSIGDDAFYGCSGFTGELVIPNSVTTIGDWAFRNCRGLTALELGTGVQTIGEEAFSGCSGLESIMVDAGNVIYDSRNNCNAIMETGTNTLVKGCVNTVISNDCTRIADYAFRYCKGLTTLTIPNSVTTIGNYAFSGCDGLTSITSKATKAPTISANTFYIVKSAGTLFVPAGATGYDTWMQTSGFYLGYYNWTLQEYTPTEGLAFE